MKSKTNTNPPELQTRALKGPWEPAATAMVTRLQAKAIAELFDSFSLNSIEKSFDDLFHDYLAYESGHNKKADADLFFFICEMKRYLRDLEPATYKENRFRLQLAETKEGGQP